MLSDNIQSCKKCPLWSKMPDGCLPVPGDGPTDAKIMLVGEALGENEVDLQKPFVGLAGRLLDNILTKAGLVRDSLYITNTVKCRPFEGNKNRPPAKEEIEACKGWLWQELQLVKPKIIVTLGKVPTATLLHTVIGKNPKMKDVVGKEFRADYIDAVFIPVYHPSFLQQHGRGYLELTTEHFKKIKELL